MVTNLPTAARRDTATLRMLGIAGMLGGPLFGIATTLWLGGQATKTLADWTGLFFLLSWMGLLTGVRLLRVTGRGKAAQILFIVQITVLCLACSQQLQEMFQRTPGKTSGVLYFIGDMSWPTSMLLMLVTFGFIVRAKVWTDWRRWPSLAHGLALPSFVVVASILGKEKSGLVFMIPLTVSFLVTGLALATNRETQ